MSHPRATAWTSRSASSTGLRPASSTAPPRTTMSVTGLEPTVIGDFDGAGHPDVLGVTAYGRAVAYAGDGTDNFGSGRTYPRCSATTTRRTRRSCRRRATTSIATSGPTQCVADQLGLNLQDPAQHHAARPQAGFRAGRTTTGAGAGACRCRRIKGVPSSPDPRLERACSGSAAHRTRRRRGSRGLTLTVKATGKAAPAKKKTRKPKTTRIGFAHIVDPAGQDTQAPGQAQRRRTQARRRRAGVKADA